jgi:hypothetical protein
MNIGTSSVRIASGDPVLGNHKQLAASIPSAGSSLSSAARPSCSSPSATSLPVYFKRTISKIHFAYPEWAAWDHQIPVARKGAKRLGIRYERDVIKQLEKGARDGPSETGMHRTMETSSTPTTLSQARRLSLIPGLPFRFTGVENGSLRSGRAIPDLLAVDFVNRQVLVVELKLRHTADAFNQLRNFYLPIVARALPGFEAFGLEICKFYDPAVRLPLRVDFISSLEEGFESGPAGHSVWIRGK